MQTGAGQTNDAESQVNADHSMDLWGPEIMKEKIMEDIRLQVVQLQQKRDELKKATNKEIASLDEDIAIRLVLLKVWPTRSASSEYSEVRGGEEQMHSFTTPVLTNGHENPLLELEASLGLEKSVETSYFDKDQSSRSPYGVDHEDPPGMNLNMPLPIPRSIEHIENNHTSSDRHASPLKKRKRAVGLRQTPQQDIGRFYNDANATMSNALNVEPAALTDEQISTSVSSFKRQPLHTFPAGVSFLTRKSQTGDTQAAGHPESALRILPANIKPQGPQS